MRRCLALAAAAWLMAACTPPQSPKTVDAARWSDASWLHPSMPGTSCRVPHADGRMQLAERGIGGTGPLTRPPAQPNPAGNPPPTGVAAVITGFGSICLAGLEVDLAPSLAVTVDGTATDAQTLAAGDRAILVAIWQNHRPMTERVAIRHEVVGLVERVGPDGSLIVAGQVVRIAPGAWIQAALAPGRWVAVSGLQQPDGGVFASRIDPAASGEVLLRGRLVRDGTTYRIGALPVAGDGLDGFAGRMVSLRGTVIDGRLQVAEATLDQLQSDPADVFGPAVNHYAIQTMIGAVGDSPAPFAVHLALSPGVALPSVAEPAVLGLERMGPAGLVATSVSPAGEDPDGIAGPAAAHPGFDHPDGMAPGGMGASGVGPSRAGPGGTGPGGGPGP